MSFHFHARAYQFSSSLYKSCPRLLISLSFSVYALCYFILFESKEYTTFKIWMYHGFIWQPNKVLNFFLFSINFARVFNTWFVFFNYYWVVSSCFHGIFSHNRKIVLWSCKTITLNIELRLYFFHLTNCTFTYIEQHLTFCFLAS